MSESCGHAPYHSSWHDEYDTYTHSHTHTHTLHMQPIYHLKMPVLPHTHICTLTHTHILYIPNTKYTQTLSPPPPSYAVHVPSRIPESCRHLRHVIVSVLIYTVRVSLFVSLCPHIYSSWLIVLRLPAPPHTHNANFQTQTHTYTHTHKHSIYTAHL